MRDQTFYWQGYCSARTGWALASVVNNSTNRAATIKIHRYDVFKWAWGTQTDVGTRTINLSRISNIITDGALSVALTHMGGTVALPSQVKCAMFAGVTFAGSIPFTRSQPYVSSLSNAAQGAQPQIVTSIDGAGRWGFTSAYGKTLSLALIGRYGQASVQPIVLREGEGIALHLEADNQLPHQHLFFLNVLLRDDTNNRTYVACCDLTNSGALGLACFALFNGVGSGVTLSLLSMSISKTGYDGARSGVPYTSGRVRFIRTRGNRHDAGEVVTPVAADPSISIPSWVSVTRGHWGAGHLILPRHDITGGYESIFDFGGAGIGGSLAQTANTEIRRTLTVFREVWPNTSLFTMLQTGFKPWIPRHHGRGEIRSSVSPPPIVLGPGEGFAVLMDDYSADRVFAGFGEAYANLNTQGVELAMSFNSGVQERAGASA